MSTVQVPQWAEAKARADAIRTANSKTKQAIRALPQESGFAVAAGVLRQPTPAQGALPIFGLITSVHHVGEYAASTVLRRAGVFNPTKRVRDLTARQRGQIADWMDCEAERRKVERAERVRARG